MSVVASFDEAMNKFEDGVNAFQVNGAAGEGRPSKDNRSYGKLGSEVYICTPFQPRYAFQDREYTRFCCHSFTPSVLYTASMSRIANQSLNPELLFDATCTPSAGAQAFGYGYAPRFRHDPRNARLLGSPNCAKKYSVSHPPTMQSHSPRTCWLAPSPYATLAVQRSTP